MKTRENHKIAIGKLIDKLIKHDFQFSKSDKEIVKNAIQYISNIEYPDFDNNLKRIFDNALAIAKMPPESLVNDIKNCLIDKDFKSIGDIFSQIKGLGIKRKTKTRRNRKTKTRRNGKTKTRRKTRQYGGDPNDVCPICLDPLKKIDENGSEITLHTPAVNAPHKFHIDCIANWFTRNNKCPVCRDVINPIPEQLRVRMQGNRRPNNGNGDFYNTIFWVVVLGLAAFAYYMIPPSQFPFDPNAPYSYLDSRGQPNPNYDPYAIDSYYYDGEPLERFYYVYERPPRVP
jgi:hypothetical protein